MRRRHFIELLGVASASLPFVAPTFAQGADRVRHLAVIMALAENDPLGASYLAALAEGLQAAGWHEGGNLRIDHRWAGGDLVRIGSLAHEVVASRPEVIVAHSSPVTAALMNETKSIPIVFVVVTEPLAQRLVTSLARPDANVTGFTNFEFSMGGKWLEILKEIAPGIVRVAVMFNPDTAPGAGTIFLRSIDTVAGNFAIDVTAAPVRDAGEIERTIAGLAGQPGTGLIVPPDVFLVIHRTAIVALAAQYRVPTMYQYDYFTRGGGLISYGVDVTDLFRRAASYVDRILKGAAAGDLPVQAPTKFQLVVNLKTAKSLGLIVPQTILARADEVIE
jgi:putative tryptophan/tyrosine transport system substrate-binding protein